MFVFELRTKRGIRLHQTYKGANTAIEEDIQDIKGTIVSDTRDGKNSGTVLVEYDAYHNHNAKEVYEIRMVPVYS